MNDFYTNKQLTSVEETYKRWPWKWFFRYYKIHCGSTIYYERQVRGERLLDWLCVKLAAWRF